MDIDPKRNEITLQETLAYLKYINRQKPFGKQEVQVPLKDYEQILQSNKERPSKVKQFKKLPMETNKDQDSKKINKNRAIKRIIDSSSQILQGFNNFEHQAEEQADKSQKSASVQFNIYLKQFNRVLEMIYNQQKEELVKDAQIAQQRQELLQNIYEFNVVQDFREILPIAFLKDKISKNNIEIMISALRDSLVVLKMNELRVYQSLDQSGTPKIIKLHQIQNVDYHIQPYIFIVLTIQKDKDRSNLYIRFDSEKNQDKWDRALYCCYMSRKMKRKDKFFVIQYPQEDVKKKEKEEIKKIAAFAYDSEPFKVIDKALNQKKQPYVRSDRSNKDDNASQYNDSHTLMSRQNTNTIKKSQTQRSINLIVRNTSNKSISGNAQKQKASERQNRSQKNDFPEKNAQTNRVDPPQQHPMNRGKTDNFNVPSQLQNQLTQRRDLSPDNNLNHIEEDGMLSGQEEEHPKQPEVVLPQEVRSVHDLQRKYVKGIPVKKEKMFIDKDKLLYLRENPQNKEIKPATTQRNRQIDLQAEIQSLRERELEYWDYQDKTGAKSQRKSIQVIKIKKILQNTEKGNLMIKHDNDKEITFIGENDKLTQIKKWIELIHQVYALGTQGMIAKSKLEKQSQQPRQPATAK